MKFEFQGVVLEMDAPCSFTLTVNGQTTKCEFQNIHPVAQVLKINQHHYILSFQKNIPWSPNSVAPSKIGLIKLVKNYLPIGLGQAKALVEGNESFRISGPEWIYSKFNKELSSVLHSNFFTATELFWRPEDSLPFQ